MNTFFERPNGSQKIEKDATRQTKKHPKMASRREEFAVKKMFSTVSIGVIQKTFLQTFMRKGLTTLNKYRNTNKMSPKITQNDSAETFTFF